jgi:hypothetical protein
METLACPLRRNPNMQDASEKKGHQVSGLQEQSRELRRLLARVDRQIAQEQAQLQQIQNRLAILSRNESQAA